MIRFGFILYVVAAAEFAREQQTAGALVAVALFGWAVVVQQLAVRTDWDGPNLDTSGYGTSLSRRSVVFLADLDRLALYAGALSVGFALFGPLLLVWALLL